jgi:hypothetical protein
LVIYTNNLRLGLAAQLETVQLAQMGANYDALACCRKVANYRMAAISMDNACASG